MSKKKIQKALKISIKMFKCIEISIKIVYYRAGGDIMTVEKIPENLKTLKELRARHGLTQSDVAHAIKMSLNNYAKIETDVEAFKKTSISTLIRIANLYGVSKDDIFLG